MNEGAAVLDRSSPRGGKETAPTANAVVEGRIIR
jgi:hypothetical protein